MPEAITVILDWMPFHFLLLSRWALQRNKFLIPAEKYENIPK
jgi:hypothetical protein